MRHKKKLDVVEFVRIYESIYSKVANNCFSEEKMFKDVSVALSCKMGGLLYGS